MTDQQVKHISQLDPTRKALMQQHIQEALLAIVVQQGGNVRIPKTVLDDMADNYALKIEFDETHLILSPQKVIPEIIKPTHGIITGSRN